MSERCPTCGAAVRVVGGVEGTMRYEPLEVARILEQPGSQLQADPDSSKDLGLGEDNKP
jgi:hypothetical protein